MPYNSLIDRTDAGALIPEEVTNEILKNVPQQSVALSSFRRVPMSRAQQRMPVLSALPTAYWVNGDTGLKQTTEQAWSNKYLNAEELAVIVPVPEAVLDDAEFDIWAEVRPNLVEALGIVIDAAVFFGTNKPSSWPNSIEDAAAAATNTYVRGSGGAGTDLADDINQAMALVEADGYDVSHFWSARTLKAALRGLRSTDDQFLFIPGMTSSAGSTLFGEQLSFMENGAWDAARADLIMGDPRQVIMSVRKDLTWKLLTEAVIQDNTGAIVYNLAQQDMVALRVVMRVAYQIANPINRINPTEATRFPFSVLRPVGFV